MSGRRIDRAALAGDAMENWRGRFMALAELISDAVLVIDRSGRVLHANQAAERMFRHGPGAMEGLSFGLLVPSPDALDEDSWPDGGARAPARRADGDMFLAELSLGPLDPARNGPLAAVIKEASGWAARDDAALRANHDPDTGLPNQIPFAARAEAALQAATAERPGALVVVSLGNHREFDHHPSRHVRAALFRCVADRLRGLARPGDMLARTGGDEFSLCRPALTESDREGEMERLADSVARVLAEPICVDGKTFDSEPVVGATMFPRDGAEWRALARNIDVAVARAATRRGHEHRVCVFDPTLLIELTTTRAIARDLRAGLNATTEATRDRRAVHPARRRSGGGDSPPASVSVPPFKMHYQPKLALDSGRVVGAEALIRWDHAAHGGMTPARFVPVAENTGIIVPLGEWIIGAVISEAARWTSPAMAGLGVAINLSPVQLRRRNLLAVILEACARHGVDIARLEFEVTESVFLHEGSAEQKMLQALRDAGASITVDDFGTGYSTLSYLQRLPVDKLKIDQSFVRRITSDPASRAITGTISALAAGIGLVSIAEGVEAAAEIDFLRDAGCGEAQGHLFARAMPADEFMAYVEARAAAT